MEAVPRIWRLGEVIADLYVVRERHVGGMGFVYRVWHREWEMELAMKSPGAALADEDSVLQFEAEAETWVELGLHPHVVSSVYMRRFAGVPCVFAEWVDGGSLDEAVRNGWLYREGPERALARILNVAIQVTWGLEHAHRNGLVHQDVKSANVMLTAAGTAKITDFGLATARGWTDSTLDGASGLTGYGGRTPAYCSPEQARGAEGAAVALTLATDVWSWAVTVLELFVGRQPSARGEEAGKIFEQLLAGGPPAPRIPLPLGLVDLLRACLVDDPKHRPREMGELGDRLVAIYEQEVDAPYPRTRPSAAELRADGLNNQALSALDLGDPDRADERWREALAADPHHPPAVYNRGLLLWRQGQLTDDQLQAELDAVRAAHADSAEAAELVRLFEGERGQVERPAVLDSGQVHAVAVNSDGRTAITSGGHAVQVWDLERGSRRHVLDHPGGVQSAAMTADGRLGVSCGESGLVRVWDLDSGQCLKAIGGPVTERTVDDVAVSADGRVALSHVTNGVLQVWDLVEGRCRVIEPHDPESVYERGSVGLSADGRIGVAHVTAGGTRHTTVWDLRALQVRHQFVGYDDLAVCADGGRAVSNAGDVTLVWVPVTGRTVRRLARHPYWGAKAAVDLDASRAVTGGVDGAVRFWQLEGGQCVATLAGHTGEVRAVALSGDGKTGLSASSDGTVCVWRLPVAGVRAPWRYSRPERAETVVRRSVAVAGHLRQAEQALAAGAPAAAAAQVALARRVPGYARHRPLVETWRRTGLGAQRTALRDIWHGFDVPGFLTFGQLGPEAEAARSAGAHGRRADGRDLLRSRFQYDFHGRPIGGPGVALASDGHVAIAGDVDGVVRVVDLDGGRTLHTTPAGGGPVWAVAVDGDGRHGFSAHGDASVRMWDLGTGRCVTSVVRHQGPVYSLVWSADGTSLVSAGGGGVNAWDPASGRWLAGLDDGEESLSSVVAGPGLRRVVARAADGRLRIWDCSGGFPGRAVVAPDDLVDGVAMSPDGRRLLTGGRDGRVRLRDSSTGACLHSMDGHTDPVEAVRVSADGRRGLSASRDGAVWVWDLEAGRGRHVLAGHAGRVWSLVVSGDGRLAVTGGEDRTVRVWDVEAGLLLRSLGSHPSGVRTVAITEDSSRVVTVSWDGALRTWELEWDYRFPSGSERRGVET